MALVAPRAPNVASGASRATAQTQLGDVWFGGPTHFDGAFFVGTAGFPGAAPGHPLAFGEAVLDAIELCILRFWLR